MPKLPSPLVPARVTQWLSRLNKRRLAQRRQRQACQRYAGWAAAEEAQLQALDTGTHWRERVQRLQEQRPVVFSVLYLPEAQQRGALAQVSAALARQCHAGWELLTDCQDDGAGAADARIRCLAREPAAVGEDMNARYNALLAHARGDYVLLLRPGDVLAAPHALLLWAEAAVHFGRPAVLYADEDGVDHRGRRHSPWFKCDWNQELQRSTHYLGHAYAVRTDLARLAGGLRDLPEETAEQLLVLRACDAQPSCAAVHVPHVLLHRQSPQGRRIDAAAAGTPAQAAAMQHYLDEQNVPAQALPSAEGGLHLRYAVPTPAPLVSIIVPTRNGLHLLRRCIGSVLERTAYPAYEVLIVDNGSDDPKALEYLREINTHSRVCVRRDDRPFNYSALNNHAIPECQGSVVALLNNDTEIISPDWLHEMVGLACRPDVGAVGARLWFSDHTLQHAGVILGLGGYAGHIHSGLPHGQPGYAHRACLAQEFSAVTAACMVMRRNVLLEVGGLDEKHLAVELNDVDLCLRVRQAGYRIIWTPFAELFHHESASRGKRPSPESIERAQKERKYFVERWGIRLTTDPAYHPALSLQSNLGFTVDAARYISLAQPWFSAST